MCLENKEVLAKNLRKYMSLNNVSATMMCQALNFKASTFSDWINAKSYPRIDKIELMANYFGIEKSDLIEDKKSITISNYTEKERLMIAKYRQMHEHDKRIVDLVINGIYDLEENNVKIVLKEK